MTDKKIDGAVLDKNTEETKDSKTPELKKLVVHGATYLTQYTKKYENRKKWEKTNDNLVISFIPGTINKVFAKKGEKVKKGKSLLILEAMKMMNDITSPKDGVIKKIHVNTGDRIPKGFVMIEFE